MVAALLRRSVTEKRMFELLAGGEPVAAREAKAIGLVNHVFADAEFEARTEAYLQNLAAKSASALSLTKQLLYHTDGMTLEKAIEAGADECGVAVDGGCQAGFRGVSRGRQEEELAGAEPRSAEMFPRFALWWKYPMARKHFEWKVRDKLIQLGERTLIVGVLNVTPDSFSDGGKYSDPDRAFARAVEMEEEGADLIDIGAESTRPGSVRISEAEELRRLVPVLKRLRNKLTVPICVDTYKSGVAEKALELGADVINDPSGLTIDPELARAARQADAGLIVNHMRGMPETWAKLPPLKNPLATIAAELDASVHRAVGAGVERRRIVIDPGLGFGKRKEQNSEILARLDELARLELPLMVGPSRKHFLARETALETEFAGAAAVTAAILYGVHLVRVHDVKAMKAVVEVADEIAKARFDTAATVVGTAGSNVSRVGPR